MSSEPAETSEDEASGETPRQRFVLDETGFEEVPVKYRRYYRRWKGAGDALAPNEVICPVCKVVIRSTRELREGDRLYCMPCMSRIVVVRGASGMLEAQVAY
jgi:formylmethanofuran dehydrogenase subunit E